MEGSGKEEKEKKKRKNEVKEESSFFMKECLKYCASLFSNKSYLLKCKYFETGFHVFQASPQTC